MNFFTFWRLIFTKLTIFIAPKMANIALFALKNQQNWFHVNLNGRKFWNFNTVVDKSSNVFEWCLFNWYFYSDPNLKSLFQNCKAKIALLNNFVSPEIHIWTKFDFRRGLSRFGSLCTYVARFYLYFIFLIIGFCWSLYQIHLIISSFFFVYCLQTHLG